MVSWQRAAGALAVATGLLVTAATTAPARATAAATTTSRHQLRHEGRWLVDDLGRVVFLHGLNAVWKHAPYVPPATTEGFTAADADFFVVNGFNAVRLGVIFAGVMPSSGVVNTAYLTKVDRVVKLFAARHIYVLLDFHQDAYAEKFLGEGFPPWAIHDDGAPFHDQGSFFANYFTLPVMRSFDHFWDNTGGVRDHYVAAWRAVAKRWAKQPYFMGYDLFNEPSGGSQQLSCFNPAGCPVFDATLQAFYDEVRVEIRKEDPTNIVWYEPQFFFNAMSRGNFTHVDDPQVGLSWHNYACTPAFTGGEVIPGEPDCQLNEPMVMDHADAQVTTMGSATLLSEFGSNDDVGDLARLTGLADEHLVGWQYWAYKAWHDPTGNPAHEGLFDKDTDLATLRNPKADVLIRPYPQAVAGIPTAMHWDPATRTLDMSYQPRAAGGPTEFFVPARHYKDGYVADVTGGRVRSAAQARTLLVTADAGAATVRVVIHPGASGSGGLGGGGGAGGNGGAGGDGDLPTTGGRTAWWWAGPLLAVLSLAVARSRRRSRA